MNTIDILSAATSSPRDHYVVPASMASIHLRDERRRLKQLASLGTNWDGRGSAAPGAAALEAAARLLPRLHDSVATLRQGWTAPHITASEAGDIVFEWWNGERKLTAYVSETGMEVLKVWGVDIEKEMEAIQLRSPAMFQELWEWLFA
jgi:hypothetical protein